MKSCKLNKIKDKVNKVGEHGFILQILPNAILCQLKHCLKSENISK